MILIADSWERLKVQGRRGSPRNKVLDKVEVVPVDIICSWNRSQEAKVGPSVDRCQPKCGKICFLKKV